MNVSAPLRRLSGGRPAGVIALTLVGAVLAIAIVGPFVSPYGPSEIVGPPFQPRSGNHWLGTDFLGRDVLTRVLHGGRTAVFLATSATAGSYVIGATIGLVAGFRQGRVDAILMRAVDVLRANFAKLGAEATVLPQRAWRHTATTVASGTAGDNPAPRGRRRAPRVER